MGMIQMEPYLQAALLCEGVSTDEYGRHTIYREFNQYTMGYSQPFTILTIWRGGTDNSDQSYSEKVEIIAPDGRVVAGNAKSQPFFLPDNTYRQVNSTLLENVDFTHDGTYELRVTLLDSHKSVICLHRYPLTVI